MNHKNYGQLGLAILIRRVQKAYESYENAGYRNAQFRYEKWVEKQTELFELTNRIIANEVTDDDLQRILVEVEFVLRRELNALPVGSDEFNAKRKELWSIKELYNGMKPPQKAAQPPVHKPFLKRITSFVPKLWVSLFMPLVFIQCNPKPSPKPTSQAVGAPNYGERTLEATDYYAHGAHYKLIQSSNGGIAVINVTQDSILLARFKLAAQIEKARK